jgi:hypothetical protein
MSSLNRKRKRKQDKPTLHRQNAQLNLFVKNNEDLTFRFALLESGVRHSLYGDTIPPTYIKSYIDSVIKQHIDEMKKDTQDLIRIINFRVQNMYKSYVE